MLGDRHRAAIARNLLRVRRVRMRAFPSELFDEYAWDMLLNLFAALTENETVSETELIRRSDVSTEVGRLWLRHLVADGQVEARHDGEDVSLTSSAISSMRGFLDEAEAIYRSPVAG